ncbi:MAG: hypothetical protein GXY47_10750 [Acidobacteria bacterium]|nr:hypothetical protein [Acidobacteriota bacterium]
MASLNSISDTTPSPTKTPAEIITRAERDLAASVAMLAALKTYLVAVDESSGSQFIDLHDFVCGMETLFDVATETVDRARESVKALVAVPLGVVVPMPEGGDE